MFPTSLVLSQTSQPVTVPLPPTSHRSPNHPYTPNAVYLLLFRISRSTATTIACQSNIHPPLVLYITPGKFSDARSVLGSIIVFFVLRETMRHPIPNTTLPILVAFPDSRFVVGLPNQYEK